MNCHCSGGAVAVVEVARPVAVVVGFGRELAANGRDVGEAAFTGSLVEPELRRLFRHGQQRELLGFVVVSRSLGHSAIIARGCDTVTG